MTKIALSFVSLHNPLFMQGVNLGQRINTHMKSVKLDFDVEKKLLYIQFKGKVCLVPDSNVESMDVIDPAQLGIEITPDPIAAMPQGPVTGIPRVDSVQSKLIEQNRALLAGGKPSAQVSDPTRPVEGMTGVTGKRKIISHAELKQQMAAEKNE